MPDITQLNAVNSLFKKAMTGAALATTNHLCKAEVIQPDLNEMFSDDKYKDVNAEILSAGGISGIIVSGRAEDGSKPSSSCDKPFDSRNSRMRAPSAACAVIGIISSPYRIMPQ